MKAEIAGLHRIESTEYGALFNMLKGAFRNYEKLVGAYPDWDDRQAAIEMVISYYLPYDLKYGEAYSLDEELNEAVVVCHSDVMDYADWRIKEACCENEIFRKASSRLSPEQIDFWNGFFDELDRQEAALEIPRPHIYVDYVAVRDGMQGQGRGSRIIGRLKEHADEMGLPIMLFTNGERDVKFYLYNGFRMLGVTRSGEYKFENTYMLYEPEAVK